MLSHLKGAIADFMRRAIASNMTPFDGHIYWHAAAALRARRYDFLDAPAS